MGYLKIGAGDGGSSKPPEPPLDPLLKSVDTEVLRISFQILRYIALRM